MEKDYFLKSEIARVVGLTERSVKFYTDRGVVVPEVYKGRQRGDHHRYSLRNLFEFAIIKRLRDFGINVNIIKAIIDDFMHDLDDPNLQSTNYEKRLLELEPFLLIHESDDKLIVEVKFIESKRLPVVTRREMKDHAAILAIDLATLFKKMRLGL